MMKAWFFGGLGIVLVLLGGLGAGLYVGGFWDGQNGPETEKAEDAEPTPKDAPPIYYAIESPFVVNLEGKRLRFLQLKVELVAGEQGVLDAVERHMPRIRNDLIMLFSGVEYDRIRQKDGRESLQEAAHDKIVEVLEAEDEPADLRAVLFTNFIVQ